MIKQYANIGELISILESDIEELKHTVEMLKKEPRNLNEEILLTYIDTRSTGKTKDFVRALDIKSERGSLYSSGDVSKLIKNGADDISEDLLKFARKVVNMKNNKRS